MKSRFGTVQSLAMASLLLLGTVGLSGCGTEEPPVAAVPITGNVAQGPVAGAKVFADHATGAEANFKIDADEAAYVATTDVNGHYTIPATPPYAYRLVTLGGIDTQTGNTALQLVAPQGARNVTPLTTVVANDTTGKVQALIQALPGAPAFDANIASTTAPPPPAAIALAQLIVHSTNSVTSTLQKTAGGLTVDQQTLVQQNMLKNIATQLATPATAAAGAAAVTDATGAAQTTLLTNAAAATFTALPTIVTPTQGGATVAVTNANNAAAAAINAIATDVITAVGAGNLTSTTGTAESTLINAADITALNTAVNTAANNAVATGVTVTQTVTHTVAFNATQPSTAGKAGTAFSFTPAVTSTPSTDTLTFFVDNLPSWATFDTTTGKVSGVPPAAGNFTLTIHVTNGVQTKDLTITIAVSTTTGGTGGTGGTGTGS